MTEPEKLRVIVDLATTLFQFTDLKILPTGLSGHEDDDYCAESYNISWSNKEYFADIDLVEHEGEYQFMLFRENYNTEVYSAEYISIHEVLDFNVCDKLRNFITFINENLGETHE